jgi:hypothetical protein
MTEQNTQITRRIAHVEVKADWSDTEALKLEILKLRDELMGAEARLGQVKAELLRLAGQGRLKLQADGIENHAQVLGENRALKQELRQLKKSTTWRIGRLVVRPLSLFKKQPPSNSSVESLNAQ